jgi:hypothetical protein
MKIAFGLIVLVIAALAIAFFAGGFSSPSVAEQVQTFNAKVRPGTNWKQVLEVMEPKQWSGIGVVQTSEGPEIVQGSPSKFVRADAEQKIAAGGFEGFVFYYSFSPEENYEVTFDKAGNVVGTPERQRSVSDLMDIGRAR